MIEWNKRAKREDTQMSDRRTWSSKCGHYKVSEHTIRYGRGTDKYGNETGYPTYYLAMRLTDIGMWDIISEHRTRSAAVSQCEYFHEHGHKKPPRNKATKAKKKQQAKRKARKAKKNDDSIG
jgi:hypothetical protein